MQFQSRSKNAAPGIDASDAPIKADCDRRYEFLDRLDRSDLHRLDLRGVLDQCDA